MKYDPLKSVFERSFITDHVHKAQPNNLFLVRGIPGSGKSTFVERSLGNSYVHLEADMYHNRYGSYNFQRDQLRAAHHWCLTTAEILLLAGDRDVVVSNTFTTFSEMRPYVDFAKKFDVCLFVYTMSGDFKNIHDVPEETLVAMKNRFESHKSILESIRAYQPE